MIAVGFSCLLVPYGAGASPLSAAETPNLITAYKVLSVGCEQTPSGNVRARVSVRMKVVNYDHLRDWAQRMKLKARLVPPTAGLNYTRAWKEARTDVLLQNHTYGKVLTVVTDTVNPAATWNVQIKLVWDRVAPIKDVVKETTRSFSCGVSLGS
jgi:hypothetical protein